MVNKIKKYISNNRKMILFFTRITISAYTPRIVRQVFDLLKTEQPGIETDGDVLQYIVYEYLKLRELYPRNFEENKELTTLLLQWKIGERVVADLDQMDIDKKSEQEKYRLVLDSGVFS